MNNLRSSMVFQSLSPGAVVILVLALLSGGLTLLWPAQRAPGVEMWIFSQTHQGLYEPSAAAWGEQGETDPVTLRMFAIPALSRRVMGGFYSGIPMADLVEIERAIVGPVFRGELDDVGFLDLTDRIVAEGLLDEVNAPSFGPWTNRGRIFGLPHDVHPVMLGYRADLIEAAGIDLSGVETWREFGEALRPMIKDTDGDGEIDHWPLAFWPSHEDNLEVLLLQGGGALFDDSGRLTMDSDDNVRILAEVVSWCVGPDRWCVDVVDFTNASNLQKIEGYALASFMPDWMCSIWKSQMGEGMAGKAKLMPLPAFEPGGRRTSVRGGSMLGIPKASENIEEAWAFAKEIYLSKDIARELYRQTDIITPIRSAWADPIYDEPDPFFMGQPKGRMYIELAPEVPHRTSSPYYRAARLELRNAAVALLDWSESERVYSPEGLLPKARELLEAKARLIQRDMDRNVFASSEGERD